MQSIDIEKLEINLMILSSYLKKLTLSIESLEKIYSSSLTMDDSACPVRATIGCSTPPNSSTPSESYNAERRGKLFFKEDLEKVKEFKDYINQYFNIDELYIQWIDSKMKELEEG